MDLIEEVSSLFPGVVARMMNHRANARQLGMPVARYERAFNALRRCEHKITFGQMFNCIDILESEETKNQDKAKKTDILRVAEHLGWPDFTQGFPDCYEDDGQELP